MHIIRFGNSLLQVRLTHYCSQPLLLNFLAIELREEVENAAARLHYITAAHDTVQNDIALTKRATEKTTTDLSRAAREKLEQVP